jgi:hypothetical protein
VPGITSRVVGGSSKRRESFVRRVVATRNYEVHLDPANQADAAAGVALLALVYQLRALVEMTLLLELGFSDDDVDAIFTRVGWYDRIEALRGQTAHREGVSA